MWKKLEAIQQSLVSVVQALDRLGTTIHGALTQGTPSPELEGRVSSLERELAKKLADVEALIVQAETRFKAARAAEERARRYVRRDADDYDDDDDDEVWPDETPGAMGGGGGGAPVQTVHEGQQFQPQPSAEAIARAAKNALN